MSEGANFVESLQSKVVYGNFEGLRAWLQGKREFLKL